MSKNRERLKKTLSPKLAAAYKARLSRAANKLDSRELANILSTCAGSELLVDNSGALGIVVVAGSVDCARVLLPYSSARSCGASLPVAAGSGFSDCLREILSHPEFSGAPCRLRDVSTAASAAVRGEKPLCLELLAISVESPEDRHALFDPLLIAMLNGSWASFDVVSRFCGREVLGDAVEMLAKHRDKGFSSERLSTMIAAGRSQLARDQERAAIEECSQAAKSAPRILRI